MPRGPCWTSWRRPRPPPSSGVMAWRALKVTGRGLRPTLIKFQGTRPTIGCRCGPIRQLGVEVTVLIPNARIAARWNGALQARLRHAPLERFLRVRGRKWAAIGDARNTDNLASATMLFVAGALESRADWSGGR